MNNRCGIEDNDGDDDDDDDDDDRNGSIIIVVIVIISPIEYTSLCRVGTPMEQN